MMKLKMNAKFVLVSLIAVLSIAMLGAFASAATLDIKNQYVQIDGLPATGNNAVIAGSQIPLTIDFTANESADEVQVSAWIQGYRNDRTQIDFPDLIAGSDYRARLLVDIPSDIEPEELLTLYVRIETDAGNWESSYLLKGERESNKLDLLLVDMDSNVKAGSTMPIGVVVSNMGRHKSEDTMVSVKIPELGIVKTVWLDDLSVLDNCEDDCDEQDSTQGRLLITIPETAKAGSYRVETTAFNDRTEQTVVKTLTVSEAANKGQVLASPAAKTFAVGEQVSYDLILVNSGDKMVIYNLGSTVSDALTVTLSDYVAAVPAGSSKTVRVNVQADKAGTYGFAVTATSDNFSAKTNYTAVVKDKSISNNNIVVLTVALAIIFVVLVVILVVLLTRKPQKSEEFGESYY